MTRVWVDSASQPSEVARLTTIPGLPQITSVMLMKRVIWTVSKKTATFQESSAVERGQTPLCAAPCGPFRQKGSVPFSFRVLLR